MDRNIRKKIANETLDAFDRGYYNKSYIYDRGASNFNVEIGYLDNIANDSVKLILENDCETKYNYTKIKYIEPAKLKVINKSVPDAFIYSNGNFPPKYKYGVLNFASAYNPGGGFLNGALAQEEALCYSSNLYYLQLQYENEFYKYNKNLKTKMYSDRMIYTPDTVFIRNSNYDYLPQPVLANILTVPAVNIKAAKNNRENIEECMIVMKNRMRKILSVFASEGNDRIILGAFGCGVFGNNPETIAKWWKELLDEGWKYQFKEVIFAVYDTSLNQNTYNTFKNVIG